VSGKALSEREQRFIEAYLGDADGHITKAALAAGYSQRTAAQQGSRLLKKVEIQQAIQQRQAKRAEIADVTAAQVIKELARIGFSDVRKVFAPSGALKPAHEWDDETAAAIAGVDVVEMAGGAAIGGDGGLQHVPMYTKKLKLWDKNSALEKLAKTLGMYHEGPQVNINLASILLEIHRERA
jgi:phage terminase small subunit